MSQFTPAVPSSKHVCFASVLSSPSEGTEAVLSTGHMVEHVRTRSPAVLKSVCGDTASPASLCLSSRDAGSNRLVAPQTAACGLAAHVLSYPFPALRALVLAGRVCSQRDLQLLLLLSRPHRFWCATAAVGLVLCLGLGCWCSVLWGNGRLLCGAHCRAGASR